MNKLLVVAIIVLQLAGCAATPQQPISLNPTLLDQTDLKVGIATTTIPEASMVYPGADCLLCLIAAVAANSKLSEHTKSLSVEDVHGYDDLILNQLVAGGASAKLITQDLNLKKFKSLRSNADNTAKRNFSSLSAEHDITHLVVIQINHFGFVRQYSAYIPTSDPQATISGSAYMVNLEDNTYSWYLPIALHQSANGEWKEPPTFPELTNAYYSVLATIKDDLLSIFKTHETK